MEYSEKYFKAAEQKFYKSAETEKALLGAYEQMIAVFGETKVNEAIYNGDLVQCDSEGKETLSIQEAVDQIVLLYIDKTIGYIENKISFDALFDRIEEKLDDLVNENTLSCEERKLYQDFHITKSLENWFELRNAIKIIEMLGGTVKW
jgi:hypothetical protein